jgi:dsRNA-specific ribonuclease
MLSLASQLAQMLVQKRRDRGALAFYDLTKGYITNENGQLERIKKKETTLAYLIVQEIMILANTNIAKFFAQKEIPFIFRNHSMKAATPERETLMDQYLVAQTDANAFDMLNNRLQILSNPALYETVLNGHYGLNETAYAHITSPIRRFSDLINHYQIKSYIKNTEAVFSATELNQFCSEINTGNAYRRDVKAEYFESKAQKILAKKAGSLSYGNLIEIPINEFRKILKAGAKLGKMRPELEQACHWRIEQQHFTSIDFYLLLKMANEEKMSHELKIAVEKALCQNPGASSQIIQFLIKEGFFLQIDKEITEAPAGGFLARYIGSYTESPTIISTPIYTWEQNKRDALNKAADNWVLAFFNDSFVDKAISRKPDQALIPAAVKNIEDLALSKENYYGKLLEIVQKENSISAHEETFVHEGTPHQPLFHYTIPLTIGNQTESFEGEGCTKKLAKQKAAKQAIEYLNKNCPGLNNNNTNPKSLYNQLFDNSNYTSILQVMLQQNPQNTFTFEHEDLGQQNTENRFSTLLTIKMNDTEYSFNSNAPSKKEGKKATAKMALDQLFNNLNLS